MIYIYFGDLDRALKFIFLRKYINQSFRESLWKFTDFLPCGKSYFSKANLCSPNLDKGIPSLPHRPFILRFERNPAVMLYFYTWQNCLRKTCARERSSSIFFNPEFCMKMAWIRYERKIKRGFRVCSRLKKTEMKSLLFTDYTCIIQYPRSRYKSYFKSMVIVNLIEKSTGKNILFLTIYRRFLQIAYLIEKIIF